MLKRILSLACCLSLTVGLFTYRPPEAKAIVTEASLATSVLWSFMQSAGLTFDGTGMDSLSWAEAIEPYLRDFTEWMDPKADSFWSLLGYEDGEKGFVGDLGWSIVEGPSVIPGYKIHVLPAVAKRFADFTVWFADKMGLSPGAGPVPLTSSGLYTRLFSAYEKYRVDNGISNSTLEGYPYRIAVYSNRILAGEDSPYRLYFSKAPFLVVRKNGEFKDGSRDCKPGYYFCTSASSGSRGLNFIGFTPSLTCINGGGSGFAEGCFYHYVSPLDAYFRYDYPDSVITVSQPGALSPVYDDSGDKATILAVSNIEGEITSINDLLQKILDKLAVNELETTTKIDGEAAPDVPATDIGWKGTIEKIYQGIVDLPGRIAEAIKDLFIPREGYAAEFVSGLTGAYQGRFGLLTYPFSVLGDFVGTVATLDEQEPILRWNDVKWQDHVVIAKGEYNLKSAIAGTEMQTVYQVYRTVASAALIVGFLHLCIRKLREVQSH